MIIAYAACSPFTSSRPWLLIPVGGLAFAIGCYITSTLQIWLELGEMAYELADEAAAELAQCNDETKEIHVTEGFIRNLIPRQMYVTAIATKGKPMVMYRGWKMWYAGPLDKPAMSRTPGFACRRYH